MSTVVKLQGGTRYVGDKETISITPDLGGESVSSASWSVVNGDVLLTGENASAATASVFIQANASGVALVKCSITTSAGRVRGFLVTISFIET